MKKISSFVLMAVMLLMSANTWAGTTRTAGSATELETAWKAAQNGDVIKLTNDITIDKVLWLGTSKMNDASRSITLDLDGWILTNNASLKYMFLITHGGLNVITSKTGGKIVQNGTENEELFRVTGSTYKNVNPKTDESGYFSHLSIGEGVTVDAKVKNAIVIDEIRNTITNRDLNGNGKISADEKNVWYFKGITSQICACGNVTIPENLPYSTQVYDGKGVANGVRIDVYGTIRGNKYAFKANGNLGSPSNNPAASLDGFYADPDNEIAYSIEASDVNYSPFIHLHSTADLRVPATNEVAKKPVAVYCSGYARWLIEGTCIGSTGVYVKSGDVDVNDATIASNYTGDYKEVEPTKSGVTGAGSAIVIESNAAYSGDIDVTVSGDSHVTATNGYAIEENVTSATTTKVDAITINGGTFEGGQVPDPEDPSKTTQGTITITGETVNNTTTTVSIIGGEVNGAGKDNVNIGGQNLEDYLSDATTKTHITTVTNSDGSKTVVITEGEAPKKATTVNGVDGRSVKWQNATGITDDMEETISSDLSLEELDITQTAYSQTLIIAKDATLTAKRVILGGKAQIIVKAGGKLIVTGEQGITANSNDNIILETSATDQAWFLVNPNVNSNRHPKAKVEMYSFGYQKTSEIYVWQRFGVPSNEASVTFNQIYRSKPSAYKKLVADNWIEISDWDEKLVPFTTYAVTAATKGAIYTFSCNLMGNDNFTLPLTGKWNYYANSYTAPISIAEIIDDYMTKYKNVSATIYLHDIENDLWHEVNKATVNTHPEYAKQIKPMQAFVIQQRTAGSSPVINYKDEVYTPTLASLSAAPAREASPTFATAVVEIVAADGTKDEVSMLEGEQFSAEFDNAYDATKLMNNDRTSIYVDGVGEKLGVFATDNLEGTTLSLDAKEQTSFIMTVRNADGMNYAIRDMLTGTEIELTEGATYMFSVPANTTVNGRFKVVGLHKVPTAIENIEEVAATKGIYNMAGQYMGNDFYSLSAGVYVVDGKKVVK